MIYKLNAADHPAGVTFGRIVVSTFNGCFDSKVVVNIASLTVRPTERTVRESC
jgi:hypothetical protein